MCRFLIVKSKNFFSLEPWLIKFAHLAKNHPTPEEDMQEDGWGVAWLNNNRWKIRKSIKPIWEEVRQFSQFDYQTNLAIFHARSASFSHHKNNLEFNQPFYKEDFLFVFNGLVSKIKINFNLEGDLGAQKIFSLILLLKQKVKKIETAIEKSYFIIKNNSEKIRGLNFALIKETKVYGFNYFEESKDYYQLWQGRNQKLICLSSNRFSDNLAWDKAPFGQVFVF